MNEIRRMRLQTQIFRHVALFFQKTSISQSTKKTLADVKKTTQVSNPFELANPADITRHVQDYATFTRCELSADGSFAKLYVSVWGSPREQARIMKDLKKKLPAVRSSIAKHIRMREIPKLAIIRDTSFERAEKIDKLLS